jgi:hypothetical protein
MCGLSLAVSFGVRKQHRNNLCDMIAGLRAWLSPGFCTGRHCLRLLSCRKFTVSPDAIYMVSYLLPEAKMEKNLSVLFSDYERCTLNTST